MNRIDISIIQEDEQNEDSFRIRVNAMISTNLEKSKVKKDEIIQVVNELLDKTIEKYKKTIQSKIIIVNKNE